jgi:hypothetical protein
VNITPENDIDVLRQRLARAESDRDAWRAAGQGERYQEAYFLVEALELQIDRRRSASAPTPVETLPGYLPR